MAANTVGCTEAVVARILQSLGCVLLLVFANHNVVILQFLVCFCVTSINSEQTVGEMQLRLQARWSQPYSSYGSQQDVETNWS